MNPLVADNRCSGAGALSIGHPYGHDAFHAAGRELYKIETGGVPAHVERKAVGSRSEWLICHGRDRPAEHVEDFDLRMSGKGEQKDKLRPCNISRFYDRDKIRFARRSKRFSFPNTGRGCLKGTNHADAVVDVALIVIRPAYLYDIEECRPRSVVPALGPCRNCR